jgi:hypothetical protein
MVNPFDMWWYISVPNFSSFEECKVTKWSRRSSFGVHGHDRHTRYLIFDGEYGLRFFYVLHFSWILLDTNKPNGKVSYFSNQLWITFEFYKIWSNKGWPDDVESVWNFLDRPTGVVSSKWCTNTPHCVSHVCWSNCGTCFTNGTLFLSLTMVISKKLNQCSMIRW